MSAELGDSIKRAVIWRSGSQIASQVVAWAATLMVIRILDPADYGLFAMTQVVIVFLNFLNGYGFAGSLIRDPELTEQKIRQAFGMLLLVNGGLALLQIGLAPLAAAYYRHPQVEQLLRAQALIFLSTPFISIPEVLLMRQMDFRRQALVNLVATLVSAGVALGCALGGLGVWTLVWAPIALFWTRALGLQLVTRAWHWPSFRFAGAGGMFSFGMALLASTFGWTVINQADTLIAARKLTPHDLGLYAEALFLTTLIATKFVPPLNEVAFPAYARMQEDRALLAASFLKAVRLIMLVTCPLYLGLSVAAPDFVAGHSLGEYSALVAAGSLRFADAVRLVRNRGRYMQEAVPAGVGAMAAILKLPAGKLDSILAEAAQGEIVSAANLNSPEQVVIAGHAGAVGRAMELAKARGARFCCR